MFSIPMDDFAAQPRSCLASHGVITPSPVSVTGNCRTFALRSAPRRRAASWPRWATIYNGKDVLWVDYKDAVSLHRVITNNPKERRLERLATPTPRDKRISYGCINVPANFFDDVVKPTFTGMIGIVYVLPEISRSAKSSRHTMMSSGNREIGANANFDRFSGASSSNGFSPK